MSEALMQKLLSAAATSANEIVLVAPFMKKDVIKEIFDKIPQGVTIKLVTRWNPAEIIAGVSDLGVFDLVQMREQCTLSIHPLLHAKLYRFDNIIYMGSANLTRKALGWASPSNLELLYEVPHLLTELKKFELELLNSSMLADSSYRDKIEIQVQELKAQPFPDFFASEVERPGSPRFWLPMSRNPKRLWQVYKDGDNAQRAMVESAFDSANKDLLSLQVPADLTPAQFNSNLAAILDQMPLVHEINTKAIAGLSTQDAILLIEEAKNSQDLPYSAEDTWEILQAWLMYFFPNRYRREASTEVFRLGRTL